MTTQAPTKPPALLNFYDAIMARDDDQTATETADEAYHIFYRDEDNAEARAVVILAVVASSAAHYARQLVTDAIHAANEADEGGTDQDARKARAHIATIAATAAREEADRMHDTARAAIRTLETNTQPATE